MWALSRARLASSCVWDCGYIQRYTVEDNTGWDEPVNEEITKYLKDIEIQLKIEGDPAKRSWRVNSPSSMNVWALAHWWLE